jgi:2-keto-3-deoxy-L-rhamnonate aldolase RhmA
MCAREEVARRRPTRTVRRRSDDPEPSPGGGRHPSVPGDRKHDRVECIEEIAAVPGFDILFIGPGDLTLSYGVPLEFNHPMIEAAVDRIAAAAAKYGKWWGTTSGSPEAAQRVVDRGGRMFTAGGDHGALVQGLTDSFKAFSKVAIAG